MQYALAILAQGFCVLKIIITQFPDGFRLNTFGSFGDGSVQVDVFLKSHLFFLKSGLDYRVLLLEYCHILMTRKYLPSHAGRSIQCFRTRENKKDFFFFTQNESEQFLLALGGVWTKTKPRKYNPRISHTTWFILQGRKFAEKPPDWSCTDKYTRFSCEDFTYPPFKSKINVLTKKKLVIKS